MFTLSDSINEVNICLDSYATDYLTTISSVIMYLCGGGGENEGDPTLENEVNPCKILCFYQKNK